MFIDNEVTMNKTLDNIHKDTPMTIRTTFQRKSFVGTKTST